MPRKRNAVPSYRRHSSGRARVSINGREYLLPGEYDSAESKAAYRKLIAEYAGSDSQAAYGLQGKAVMAELLMTFLEHAKDYYGTSKNLNTSGTSH